MLDPCMTVKLMGEMMGPGPHEAGGSGDGAADYLPYMVAWLSLVAPPAGLCDGRIIRKLTSKNVAGEVLPDG